MSWIAPIGTIFVNLIKMMIVPVVFTSLVVGMTSLGDMKTLGGIGILQVGGDKAKTLIKFFDAAVVHRH